MIKSLIEDIKREYKYGSMVNRLIIINVFAFFLINLALIGFKIGYAGEVPALFYKIVNYLSVSSDPLTDLRQPWGIVTYNFIHIDFFHLLWNMVFLFWIGRIVGDLIGNHRVLPLYLLGGISGAVFYIAGYQLFFDGKMSYAMGASASVMALVLSAGTLAPDYNIRLLLLGDVKLKYIVLVILFLDVLGIANLNNTGGHMAHLGGAFFGWLYVFMLRQGRDLIAPVVSAMNILKFKKSTNQYKEPKPLKRKTKVAIEDFKKYAVSEEEARKIRYGASATEEPDVFDYDHHQETIDRILEKIKKHGYDNLTAPEKEFLKKASDQK